MRGQRQAVGADLVGHVAVGRHPVAADDHGVDRPGRDQPGRGRVDHQLVRDPHAGQLVDGQAGALEEGRDSVAIAITRASRSASSAITASAVPRPGAASAPVLQWVRIRPAPAAASRSAPWAAIAALAASSSASIARASARAAALGSIALAARAASRTRSTAPLRLTAVGRAVAEGLAGALEALGRRIARQLECHPVGGGDPDQRRAADRQAADRACATSSALRSASSRSAQGSSVWSIGAEQPVEAERDDARGRDRSWPSADAMGRDGILFAPRGAADRPAWGIELRLPADVLVAAPGSVPAPAQRWADGGPIMPLSQVQPGMNCTGETRHSGHDDLVLRRARDRRRATAPGEGPRILVSVSGPAVDSTGVGRGLLRVAGLLPGRTRRAGQHRGDLRGHRAVRQQRRARHADRADAGRAGQPAFARPPRLAGRPRRCSRR